MFYLTLLKSGPLSGDGPHLRDILPRSAAAIAPGSTAAAADDDDDGQIFGSFFNPLNPQFPSDQIQPKLERRPRQH